MSLLDKLRPAGYMDNWSEDEKAAKFKADSEAEERYQKEVAERKRIRNESIVRDAVDDLEIPMQHIVIEMKDSIERGDYGLIIGDDSSGRIPALILGKFMQEISQDRELEKPKIIFIPGHVWGGVTPGDHNLKTNYVEAYSEEDREEYLEKIDNVKFEINQDGKDLQKCLISYLESLSVDKNKRILIVTEIVETGNALSYVQILRDAGYGVDIASVSMFYGTGGLNSSWKRAQREGNLDGVRVYVGSGFVPRSPDGATPLVKIHANLGMSGVERERGDTVSKPIRNEELQHNVRVAREAAGRVTESLLEWYKEETK